MSHFPDIIAISGVKRSGKGTIMSRLTEQYGYKTLKFADPIKAMLRPMFREIAKFDDETIDRCIESDLKEVPIPLFGGHTSRYMMQTIGTEYRIQISPTMYVDIIESRIKSAAAKGERVGVDDLRFDAEFQKLKELNANLWLVERIQEHKQGKAGMPPWNINETPSLDIPRSVFNKMVVELLTYCDLGDRHSAEQHIYGNEIDTPINILRGATARDCLNKLESYWCSLLRKTPTETNKASASHVSEKGLPKKEFEIAFENNGSIIDLYHEVDSVMNSYILQNMQRFGTR